MCLKGNQMYRYVSALQTPSRMSAQCPIEMKDQRSGREFPKEDAKPPNLVRRGDRGEKGSSLLDHGHCGISNSLEPNYLHVPPLQ